MRARFDIFVARHARFRLPVMPRSKARFRHTAVIKHFTSI